MYFEHNTYIQSSQSRKHTLTSFRSPLPIDVQFLFLVDDHAHNTEPSRIPENPILVTGCMNRGSTPRALSLKFVTSASGTEWLCVTHTYHIPISQGQKDGDY